VLGGDPVLHHRILARKKASQLPDGDAEVLQQDQALPAPGPELVTRVTRDALVGAGHPLRDERALGLDTKGVGEIRRQLGQDPVPVLTLTQRPLGLFVCGDVLGNTFEAHE